MPRAIVMMRGENLSEIRSALTSYNRKRHNRLTEDTGVLVEWYLEALGWPDFLVSLWGQNTEMIIKAIEIIRQDCRTSTTTIVGVTPEETAMRQEEMKSKAQNMRRRGTMSSKTAYIDNAFVEYISWQKAFLKQIEDDLGKKVEAKKI